MSAKTREVHSPLWASGAVRLSLNTSTGSAGFLLAGVRGCPSSVGEAGICLWSPGLRLAVHL